MKQNDTVNTVIDSIFKNNRGILASDESVGTISKRLSTINLESTPEVRRTWRNLLLSTPDIEQHIGGVILFEETLYQKTNDGIFFPEYLKKRGIIPGIKVDKGTHYLSGFQPEKITEGLDGLSDRLKNYKNAGAEFAKWRAVFIIGDKTPTQTCIISNAEVLARYAALCQENGIIPIVEPEVLMDGSHTINACESITTNVLNEVYYHLYKHGVILKNTILKPNMVLSGKDSIMQNSDVEIASATVRTLKSTVPASVPAIAFLSGGQEYIKATSRLNQINKLRPFPWIVAFSFSRALQDPVMKMWNGNPDNITEAQKIFFHRVRCNSLANQGEYTLSFESEK